MSKVRFVCLANSFKEGGRCLAGIQLDENDNPVIINGNPKWIRPICDTPHGEVPNEIAVPFQIFDIIEIVLIEEKPELYQTENVLFDTNSILKVGEFPLNNLSQLCQDKRYIFKTRYPSLSEEVIKDLDYSLMLIKPDEWQVVEREYEDRTYPQQRMVFKYNGFTYDFSITDLDFLKKYQANPSFIDNTNDVILSLSVGVKFPTTERYYKLVAGVILI